MIDLRKLDYYLEAELIRRICMYDLIIKNGEIIDGTGKASYIADIGIIGDCIIEIQSDIKEEARHTIDASNLVVSPGFIDIDSHSDFSLYFNPYAESKIRQGITTEVVGQGGRTLGPINKNMLSELKQCTQSYVQKKSVKNYWNWDTQYEFIKRLEDNKISVNIASLVGYGSIRVAVMGFSEDKATSDQLNKMADLLEDELKNGIHGLSFGFDNSPDSFASLDEIVQMAKIVKKYDGICTIHMREESVYLLKSVNEVLEICRLSGIKLQISHLKAAHPQNWGKVLEAIQLINKGKQSGLDIDYDVYPYVAYESVLNDVFPPWLRGQSPKDIVEVLKDEKMRHKVVEDMLDLESTWGNPLIGSSWSQITITSVKNSSNKKFIGMDIAEISTLLNKVAHDVVIDLIIEEEGVIKIIFAAMIETDLEELMKQPMAIYSSDGLAVSPNGCYKDMNVHPRYYGTFPRVLGRYVREKQLIAIEDAIRNMTLLPALKMNILDRGLIEKGYKADITIFDKTKIIDTASYQEPHQYPKGIDSVIVNGIIVVHRDQHTRGLPGVVIRRV